MPMLREFFRNVKLVVLGYRLCPAPACGQFFRGKGYAILGRTYCSETCAPALYRKVVRLRRLERANEELGRAQRELAQADEAVRS